MDRWNRISNSIQRHKDKNSKEELLHSEFEYILEYILGWSYNEIITKKRNKVFSSGAYVPDIIIKNNENELIVIEIKRANIPLEKHKQQLFDYMRLKYARFGLLIGEKLQIFCEIPINSNPPKLILETEFKKDNLLGLEFIKLFSKETFSIQSIENFANQKLIEIEDAKTKTEIIDYLTSQQGNKDILQLIYQDLKTKYSPKIIDELENDIYIKIGNKVTLPITENTYNTSKKEIVLKDIFSNKSNGELIIGKFVRKTFSELVQAKLISIDEVEKLQRKDYSKQTFDIQYPFLSKELKEKYWKNYTITINNISYFVCSEWYESPANNDRPYYENWLKKMKAH